MGADLSPASLCKFSVICFTETLCIPANSAVYIFICLGNEVVIYVTL